MFALPNAGRLQVTPVVVGGIMYVTAPTNAMRWTRARAGRSGTTGGRARRARAAAAQSRRGRGRRPRLHRDGPRAPDRAESVHRRAGVGHRDGRLAAELLRDVGAAAGGNLVVAGIGGGEHGARGFLAAYDQATGQGGLALLDRAEAGRAGVGDLAGKGIEHGGAPTWFTGTYDPALDIVYWPTGNPAAEYNGDDREGDNLYSDCILALDAKTGKLKWHYQSTPHDLWDWDATETPVLVDADWEGRRASCCCTAIATASSTCSTGRTASCCWRNRSSGI